MYSRKRDEKVQLYAFDILAFDGEDLRGLPLSMREQNLAQLLARRPDGIFVAPFASVPIEGNPSSTERWNDVPRGTMDEVSSHVRLDLPVDGKAAH